MTDDERKAVSCIAFTLEGTSLPVDGKERTLSPLLERGGRGYLEQRKRNRPFLLFIPDVPGREGVACASFEV